ncbi:MAG: DUF6152 family protein [Alphaproteobacteria bacterium]
MHAFLLGLASAAALAMAGATALAHHGWAWTTGGNVVVEGVIREARLGLPHGVLKLDVNGEIWEVEVGQPWRNERAGLKDSDFAPGKEIKVVGEPAAEPEARRVKAERVYIGDKEHALYPERD